MASTRPPVHELEFLTLTSNYREFDRKLHALQLSNLTLGQHAEFVGAAWLRLGDQHLAEAKALLPLKKYKISLDSLVISVFGIFKVF